MGKADRSRRLVCLALASALAICLPVSAQNKPKTAVPAQAAFAKLHIPKLEAPPTMADFADMRPSPAVDGRMLKVEGFLQRDPKDGEPVSQKTELYLGYTDRDLYVVCICFDNEMRKVRARMGRREIINDDDQFGFVLDTFRDKKHGLFFFINAMGIQQDGIWTDNQDPDYSYDMVWRSDAKITGTGYIAFFAIPFRSLRFPANSDQTWGMFFERDIKHNNEASFYPRITSNAQGFLAQEVEADGIKEISPGRNMQFIPYLTARTFRSLDDRDPNNPLFTGKHLEMRPGLDTKIVLKDALVLDATINPDFSQVESDEPQVTVNQRFEVFFPEKRPFFLENAAYFDTPMQLVFTRRIADPEYGIRLTGKLGRWSLGTLFADDKSPGTSVAPYDPLAGRKAYFSVLRVNYDIGKESTLGFIYTDRELNTVPNEVTCTDNPCIVSSNRVGGIDAKIKFSPKWSGQFQAVTSHTEFFDGTHEGAPAYFAYVERSSRNLEYNVMWQDTSAHFETDTGFFRRPDIRRFSQFAQYRFRHDGKLLQWHGPSLFTINNWDHTGTRLEWFANLNYRWVLQNQTDFGFYYNLGHERLRPVDFPDNLRANQDYTHYHVGTFFNFAYFKPVTITGELNFGTDTNYDPQIAVPVVAPFLAKSDFAQLAATVRPARGLTVENSYLFTRLHGLNNDFSVFNNHIIRSKWNYQFTRALSLRVIGQYTTTLANPNFTSLQTTKEFNGDVLVTYLLHPGTAFYVGYNSDLQNLDPRLLNDPNGNLLRGDRFINQGRQFFVKISYLFQY